MNDSPKKWYYKLWFIIAMLIAVGPFAFPLLWKSPEFNKLTKWILTILFLGLTAAALWLSVETVKFAVKRFEELRATLLF